MIIHLIEPTETNIYLGEVQTTRKIRKLVLTELRETTGIVNEPLMKIGDYADTVSMEQAGVKIPTNRGNTVIDVETTLKPSEVYIKYRG